MIRWWREQLRLAREEARVRDLDRANRLRDRGRYAASEAVLRAVLRRHPGDAHAERVLRHLACAPDFDRASALFKEGRDDEAVAIMWKLAERLPESPDAHVLLAATLVSVGQEDDASEHGRRAAALAWNDPGLVLRAANTVRWADGEAARRMVERVDELLASRPDERFPLIEDLWYLKGLLAWQDGDLARSRELLERAFDADPEGIGHGADLAVAYFEDGRAEDALDVIARALEHHPGNERLLDIRARIQLD